MEVTITMVDDKVFIWPEVDDINSDELFVYLIIGNDTIWVAINQIKFIEQKLKV